MTTVSAASSCVVPLRSTFAPVAVMATSLVRVRTSTSVCASSAWIARTVLDHPGPAAGAGGVEIDQPAGVAQIGVGDPGGSHGRHGDSILELHGSDSGAFEEFHASSLTCAAPASQRGLLPAT
jgi:hypothetical protein